MAFSKLSDECHEGTMTALGIECFDEADHERCSGGQTTLGVMGGWVCSCWCHRRTGEG